MANPPNLSELEKASKAKSPQAKLAYAVALRRASLQSKENFEGNVDKKKLATVQKLTKESAAGGSPEADAELAYQTALGMNGKADRSLALSMLARAQDKGSIDAAYFIGLIHEHSLASGEGSIDVAINSYQKAAAQGNAKAMNNLGALYMTGFGVQQSFSQAAKLFIEAGQKQEPAALVNLGIMYTEGYGVTKDPGKAFGLFKLAADAKDRSGQLYTGLSYLNASGVERDFVNAKSMLENAAYQGDTLAMYYLGIMYSRAIGVPENKNTASYWWSHGCLRNSSINCESLKTAGLNQQNLRFGN